ncbi:hypothetical protein K3495_g292 [Podosphaera aphanis]|nr:hypothetical protein K3495_g292 [Podosphaera aphanis]
MGDDYERSILEQYQLTTAYPSEWPADKDASDSSESEDIPASNVSDSRRPKSRYSALVRAASDRKSFVAGSQKTENGIENLVQRDEPDPLGSTDSVVGKLKSLGLPVQDDIRLRNKFLLSSTTFSPSLLLSQVHANASTQDLLEGLEILSQSIDQKSASLKVLVESNFERFVRAKATIDNVYKEMRYRGEEPVITIPSRPSHSRHASRNSFRASSGNQTSLAVRPPDTKKKNALTKESEYGVLGIKSHLLDVSAKAEEVWGPALGGDKKEESFKLMTSNIDQYKEMYGISASISDCIKRKDYEAVVEEYRKAKRFADDVRNMTRSLGSTAPTNSQIYQILLAARIWNDVEELIEDLKRDVWRKLIAAQNISQKNDGVQNSLQNHHMEYIGILLELDVTENPISVWLLNRYNYLKSKIQNTSDTFKIEIEIYRRRLANGEKPTIQMTASNLIGRYTAGDKPSVVDSSEIIELWERINSFISCLLSSQGILGEIVDYWQTIQNFIDGKAQQKLPSTLSQTSSQHYRLSENETSELRQDIADLIDSMRETVVQFFFEPPIDDISSLFSPLTPRTPAYPRQLASINLSDSRMGYDVKNLPPPSPKRGEPWEKFAFWPPWSNSLSGVYFLGKILIHVGSAANEMAAMSRIRQGDGTAFERLKSFVNTVRERSTAAICAAWNRDAENIKVLEDWRRSSEKRDLTKMPMCIGEFESAILSGMQKILFISEASAKSDSTNVITPPPTKLLQMVQSQFVTTLYKSLAGLVENAEKSVRKADDELTLDADGLASPAAIIATSLGAGTVNASDRNVRMLLTLSNLQALRFETVPNLITQFENSFSVKLTEESKTIRDVLGQIDSRLFSSYMRSFVDSLRTLIRAGITSPSWSPTEKPQEVRPYVYEVLLSLVLVHTQVSTTASSLTAQVLSYLLEQVTRELLDAFKLRQRWTLPALMQATLDVEFISQTLSQYNTEKASDLQSQIYQELDKGTDNDARAKLQIELPEMRAVLKNLRDASRSEFVCFKKRRIRTEKSRAASVTPTQ